MLFRDTRSVDVDLENTGIGSSAIVRRDVGHGVVANGRVGMREVAFRAVATIAQVPEVVVGVRGAFAECNLAITLVYMSGQRDRIVDADVPRVQTIQHH